MTRCINECGGFDEYPGEFDAIKDGLCKDCLDDRIMEAVIARDEASTEGSIYDD